MGEFLKVMELKYSLSRQLTDCKANIMNVPKEPKMVQIVWTDKWLTTTILDKTVEKIVYLDSIFLNIVAVPVLPSPPSPASNVVVYSKESLISGRLWKATLNWGKGFSFRKGVVLEIVLLRKKVDMMGKLSQVVLSGIGAQHYQIRCTRSPAHKTLSLRATLSRTTHMVNSF